VEAERTVLITGASGGIGDATVQAFRQVGWEVIAVDRAEAGGESKQLDVSNPEAVSEFFASATEQYPALHALVNNAAIQVTTPLLEMTPEAWDEVMASNLRSVFLMSKYAYPMLKRARGSIVNVSSVHALATSANIAAYAASKGAVLALTRAMALEFAADQVRVNALLPGAVDTEMLLSGLHRSDEDRESQTDAMQALASRIPLGRVAQPAEIAQAIVFLADHRRSSYMTGQALVVDGGATAQLSTE
jgi:NAD(P)-dependent dehydrogenase (short-subunit alcohol dehydrogenase family)